ncbi:sigma-70 family RNA polymerase sigma factor [Enterococcus timonensis]|uniref:sigma-70 family RNA polymerase sigma factor n=1 Tax=Enterococcus timonensis TaxID=1852364 RepID=UPI0008DA48E0|nr:sigma-70 family RNA polymerase sigma factor [Enterococcus timonensis]
MTLWIEEIKAGNTELLLEKYVQHFTIVNQLRRSFYIQAWDYSDWLDQGLTVFHESIQHFSDQRVMNFELYFEKRLKRVVVNQLRNEIIQNWENDQQLDLFEVGEEPGCESTQLEQWPQELPKNLHLHRMLTNFEKNIIDFYVNGVQVEKIAAAFSCKEEKIHGALQKITEKFRRLDD